MKSRHTCEKQPLHLIVTGTAGTGKSYLIHCLKQLLQNKLRITAPTGIAAFTIQGQTLHSLLDLPTRGEFKQLQGQRLVTLQERMQPIKYLIIDEISMVGHKMFGYIDKRLRQAFPHACNTVLSGCSCILFGDFGQLPPVMDLPLYTSTARSAISDLGRTIYQQFNKAIVLQQVVRQSGTDPQQLQFHQLLMRLRNACVSLDDWKLLMTRIPSCVHNKDDFSDALHLHPTVESVVKYNIAKLNSLDKPIANINAINTGPNASRASPDDAGGLYPQISLCEGARVMLTSNLWIETGLVNGAMGTVVNICYENSTP